VKWLTEKLIEEAVAILMGNSLGLTLWDDIQLECLLSEGE